MDAPIRVNSIDDFKALAEGGLATVVDPMVFRAGEIFLRGRKGLNERQQYTRLTEVDAWDFLDKNLEALRFFFDALILNERLPLFNYSDTFDSEANFEERALSAINAVSATAVLVAVNVERDTYLSVKKNAVERLKQHLDRVAQGTKTWVDADLAKSITQELSQSGYRWEPRSPEIEAQLNTDQDRALVRFLLGGMVFGQYADLMNSEHWLQPKRSRLFVQATIDRAASKTEDERQLFERLGTQYKLPFGRTWQPTFMHYILAKADKRDDIPLIIMRLRTSGAVRDYRGWRENAVAEWQRKGGVSEKTAATIASLKHTLAAEGIAEDVQDASVSWVETAATAAAAAEPTTALVAGIATAVIKTAPPAWNFVQSLWPGRRHIKLLAESIRVRQRYPEIVRAVSTLWRE